MKKKNKVSKELLITSIVLTIIYTIIIIVPLFDIVGLTLSSIVDNDVDLISKIILLFEGLSYLVVLALPYYFLTRKDNKKKNIRKAMLTETIVLFLICFLLWLMAPAICTNDNNGGQWESVNNDTTDNDNIGLICKFINK